MDWVGEWHTHPGGMARPSFIDGRTWRRISQHTGKPMTFIILSDAEEFLGLQLPHASKAIRLRLVERAAGYSLFGATDE
jgi:proteasome lid subunit RPN8/RPN11